MGTTSNGVTGILAGPNLSVNPGAVGGTDGIGIGIGTTTRADLIKSTTAAPSSVTLVSGGLTGRLTLEYTTPGTVAPGDIRLRLFGGDTTASPPSAWFPTSVSTT